MSISLQQLNEYLMIMCGTFRQAAPGVAVQRVILGQVGNFPPEFFEWACARMAELDQLPRNLGKTLAGDFWPEWRARHPELAAREQRICRDCAGRFDVAGYGFYAWAPDGAGGWWEYFLPCRCMDLPAGFKSRAQTKREALARGWKLAPPDWGGSLQEFSHRLRHGRPAPAAGQPERAGQSERAERDGSRGPHGRGGGSGQPGLAAQSGQSGQSKRTERTGQSERAEQSGGAAEAPAEEPADGRAAALALEMAGPLAVSLAGCRAVSLSGRTAGERTGDTAGALTELLPGGLTAVLAADSCRRDPRRFGNLSEAERAEALGAAR